LTSVDGADCRIPEHGREFYSHKFKKSGLRYEVGVSLKKGDLVWINGPFPCGLWPDIKIFRDSLLSNLDESERVEADDGYIGEAPGKVKCPKSFANRAENEAMQARARRRQETINKRLKQWGCLSQMFRHDLVKHGTFFRAVAVITQLSIDAGEPLFSIDYSD